jgi:hypothetical protein
MRQEREPEAGKYKHNNAEHSIWIFDRRTVLRYGWKRYLTPQVLRFSFALDRIVHLPVPSEGFRQRGKRFLKSLAPTTEARSGYGTGCGMPYRKITKVDSAKESADTREKSEETMDASSPRCCALLTLTAVDHRRSARHKVAL